MAKKNNIGLYSGIAVGLIAIMIIVAVIIIKNNNGNSSSDNTSGQNTSVNSSEYDNVDVSIEFGDYAGMEKLSKAIQNGEMTGKIVKIEGTVSHPMTKYSVVQANSDGSKKIGTEFIINGSDNYPKDNDRIVITGKIIEKEPLYYVIETIPEKFEIKS